MIREIRLLHYLTENTYGNICEALNLDASPSEIGDNFVLIPNGAITKIHMFNIKYQQFGRIWFMHVSVDFPRFDCSYDEFPSALYDGYARQFGHELLSEFPAYDALNCDYIEYADTMQVENADRTLARLLEGRCVPEQLDREKWRDYQKAHGTIEFCMAKADDTHLDLLARAWGTALKKRIKDTTHHRATGITPRKAVNAETEQEIMDWLIRSYKI